MGACLRGDEEEETRRTYQPTLSAAWKVNESTLQDFNNPPHTHTHEHFAL